MYGSRWNIENLPENFTKLVFCLILLEFGKRLWIMDYQLCVYEIIDQENERKEERKLGRKQMVSWIES